MMKYNYLVFFTGTKEDNNCLMFGKGNLELDQPVTNPDDCAQLEMYIKELQGYETLTLTGIQLIAEWDTGSILP